MMKINDLGISVIRESAVLNKIDTAGVALMESEIKNILESVDSIESVKMNANMVRLYEQDNSYYIELDELHKFCESTEMDSIDALNAIAEYYNSTCPVALDATNFFVAIESEDTYSNLSRLASDGDITAASILESRIKEIKTLKESGVTIVKQISLDESALLKGRKIKFTSDDPISNKDLKKYMKGINKDFDKIVDAVKNSSGSKSVKLDNVEADILYQLVNPDDEEESMVGLDFTLIFKCGSDKYRVGYNDTRKIGTVRKVEK